MYSYGNPRKPKTMTLLPDAVTLGISLAKKKNVSFSRLVENLILDLYEKEKRNVDRE